MGDAPTCHDMKVGQIWMCDECGLELKVMKACTDESSGCCDEDEDCCAEGCEFTCCGDPLTLKTS